MPALKAMSMGCERLLYYPDGRLASGSGDTTVRLWDVHMSTLGRRGLEGHGLGVWRPHCSEAGQLASGAKTKTIRIWDIKTGAELSRIRRPWQRGWAFAILPDGRLVTGSDDRTIRTLGSKNGAETARLEGHDGGVNRSPYFRTAGCLGFK